MKLRLATTGDAAGLAELGRTSFCAAFEHLYDPADLAAFLAASKTPQAYGAILADPGQKVAVTEDGGALTGFCTLGLASEYARHSDAARPISIGQLYTDPARTGEGIGALLMQWVLGVAKAANADAIQLSVWSENYGAQRFYARYGFAKIADIEFWVGRQCDHEFLFELRL